MWEVQTGKGKGKYAPRYTFDNALEAWYWYRGINTHSGHKKRLLRHDGGLVTVVARHLS
jgi:hypothetical protein